MMEEWIIPAIIGAIFLLIVLMVLMVFCYKVAPVDKALIITGGRKPRVKVGGGGFVIPVIRRYVYFDLCMITVEAAGDEIKTTTGVPITVNWTAQIRPDSDHMEQLLIAARSFLERGPAAITKDIKLTLDGGVREVVAGLTPEQVLREKDAFSTKIRNSVAEEMSNMGFILVSLNIQDVTDTNGYFDNLAAEDMEAKRQSAAMVTATAEQAIRQRHAEAEKMARETELASDLAVAKRQRDNAVSMAEMKTETDKAQADANIAGQLQSTVRQRELAEQEGQVEVARQIQANLAAQKKKEVIATEAEASKRRLEIEADAKAAVVEKEAAARALAAKTEAMGEAEALRARAEAEAAQITMSGKAEADIIRQKGDADAEAIKAKMLAEAEGERALADARAANEGVNYKVTIAEIQAEAQVKVATAAAEIMASIGTNARFVNFGGGSNGDSNVLFDTLLGVPGLIEKLNTTNQAVNPDGEDFNKTLNKLVSSLIEPLSALNKQTVVSSDLAPQAAPGDQAPAEPGTANG